MDAPAFEAQIILSLHALYRLSMSIRTGIVSHLLQLQPRTMGVPTSSKIQTQSNILCPELQTKVQCAALGIQTSPQDSFYGCNVETRWSGQLITGWPGGGGG